MDFDIEKIDSMIYLIRGLRVMLDSDLAQLYGVEVKRLNEQVRRNTERFPEDFMFQLSSDEYNNLKSQFATSSVSWGGKRKQPLVFTENGMAMLSSVLNNKQAIQVNISIMRIFTKLRSFLMLEKKMIGRIDGVESRTNNVFRVVFERLDNLEDKSPILPKERRKIGLEKKSLR
jgi:hypothetical protein